MGKNNVRLSGRHGVNPTVVICFWCGQDNGEIALLGKLPGDVEAPRRMMLNYNPCNSCKELMSKGITMMEASDTPGNDVQPDFQGYYPTGRWLL